MNLKETIDKLPHTKAIKFFEIFFNSYEKYENSKKKKLYVVSKYGEEEYIKLLKRSLTNEIFTYELEKMIPRTSFAVFKILMFLGLELQEISKYTGKEV